MDVKGLSSARLVSAHDFLLSTEVVSTVSREEGMDLFPSRQSNTGSDSDNISDPFVALQETPLHDVTSSLPADLQQ